MAAEWSWVVGVTTAGKIAIIEHVYVRVGKICNFHVFGYILGGSLSGLVVVAVDCTAFSVTGI